jgi:hypothetical protein
VPLPLHDVATVTEAFRRAVLRLFVPRALLDRDTAANMLAWPHAGFHVHDGVWVPADERAFATRLARYCARPPVALRRLTYPAAGGRVAYHSDKTTGPTAGAETLEALEFLARVVSHIPNKGQVLQRYYGWYANRTRGHRRQAGGDQQPAVIVANVVPPARVAVRRRWAELLRRIFEVDPLRCPRCGTTMRIVAFLTAPPVIDRILTHLCRAPARGRRPRAPPRRRATARPVPSA